MNSNTLGSRHSAPLVFALACGLCLSLLSAKVPAVAEEMTSEQYYERGYKANENRQYADAVADFTVAIQKNPEYWKAYANRAVARYYCKNYQGSLEDINIATPHLPPLKTLTDLKASIHQAMAAQSTVSTRPVFINTFGGDPTDPGYGIVRLAAIVRARGGKIPSDLVKPFPQDLVKPMSGSLVNPSASSLLNPSGSAEAPSHSASVTMHRSEASQPATAQTAEHLLTAQASEPPSTVHGALSSTNTGETNFSAQDWFERGMQKNQASDFSGAIKDFDQCLRINPDHGAALAARGQCRFNLGDHRGALDDLNKSLGLMPDNLSLKELRDKLASALQQLDEMKKPAQK